MMKRKINENKVILHKNKSKANEFLPGINPEDTPVAGDPKAAREDHNTQI